MKKLLAIMMMVLPMLAGAQTPPPIKVFGIPLGITVEEFKTKVKLVNAKLPAI